MAKHLVPRSGPIPIGSIEYPMVLGFVTDLQTSGVAAKTVRIIRNVLRMIMWLAVRSGAVTSNPVAGITVGRRWVDGRSTVLERRSVLPNQ